MESCSTPAASTNQAQPPSGGWALFLAGPPMSAGGGSQQSRAERAAAHPSPTGRGCRTRRVRTERTDHVVECPAPPHSARPSRMGRNPTADDPRRLHVGVLTPITRKRRSKAKVTRSILWWPEPPPRPRLQSGLPAFPPFMALCAVASGGRRSLVWGRNLVWTLSAPHD